MAINSPVRFDPSVEDVQPDESEVIGQLNDSFQTILETTSADYGHAVRSVHAKAHGIAKGKLTVHADLPPELAQGVFARPATYEAVIRISTNPGDILDDSIALPRGLALKLIGVEGERLPGSEGDTTQDFIMVNGPAFSAKDAKAFSKNLKLLAGTTDKAEGAKKVLSGVLRAFEATLEAVGLESSTLQTLGGAPQVHPLGETYYSQTPFRYGDYIAKFSLAPVSPALTQLTGDTVSTKDRPDALREVVNEVMASQGGTWELRVQLNRDLDAMPVEDPTKPWDEDDSPFVTVATLDMPPQLSWEHGSSDAIDDALSYSIWHGIAAHRPLGNINRARKDTYDHSADFRGKFNGCPLHQPKALAELP
ncbi:catalase family protein [Sphingomonas mollis]|uniref:Catalase family protein n=1 Tax=Sphingomonas mollis TaxID=2795726 RepID=A0ABS0XLB3_9SPHN|nr:catalase family protein [Sphingomonas sp. BT553]MBJ6120821.1 catalase family protein [Sphingomonas sp. BT553]